MDTCVLVNIRDIHNDSDEIWQAVRASIQADQTKTVRHVFDELKNRFPPIHSRLKDLRKQFLISDADTYDDHVKAEIRAINQAHQGLYSQLGSANSADPFLIAVAKAKSAIVVTDEKTSGPKHKFKIPYVCKSRNVGHANRIDYLKAIGIDV